MSISPEYYPYKLCMAKGHRCLNRGPAKYSSDIPEQNV